MFWAGLIIGLLLAFPIGLYCYMRGSMNATRHIRGIYYCWPKRDHEQHYNREGIPIFPPDYHA